MERLEIKPVDYKSAEVNFSPEGVMSLIGVSCEEDPKPFYQKLMGWISEYFKAPAGATELKIRLKYFNTSTAKCLLDMLEKLVKEKPTSTQLTIVWCYEENDEDMLDAISTFEDLINFPINKESVASYS